MYLGRHVIVPFITILLCSHDMLQAQSFGGRYQLLTHRGVVVDSLPLMDWPNEIPSYAFTHIIHSTPDRAKLIDPITLIIPLSTIMSVEHRSYVGIYHAGTFEDITDATLYKAGMGITQLKVPLQSPGYYIAIILYNDRTYSQLFHFDGEVIWQGRKTVVK